MCAMAFLRKMLLGMAVIQLHMRQPRGSSDLLMKRRGLQLTE